MFRVFINILRKTVICFFILLFLTSYSYADTFKVPCSVSINKIIKVFKRNGLILDKTSEVRGKNSIGFIRDNGTSFDIVTYRPVTQKGLVIIQDILVNEVMNGKI